MGNLKFICILSYVRIEDIYYMSINGNKVH